MNAITLTRSDAPAGDVAPSGLTIYEDPLDADDSADIAVATTRRGLTRLALVAAETGARFQREEVGHDPMAWLLAPRRLFGGAAALQACLGREDCLRAVLLHGLSLGLDAPPGVIDALLAESAGADGADGPWAGREGGGPTGSYFAARRMRLYTATIVLARGGELLHAFHASVAPSASVVRERIRARLGSAAAAQADIRVGYDPDCPASAGMVPPAIMATLVGAGRRTRWSEMAGLDVTVEQRIPS